MDGCGFATEAGGCHRVEGRLLEFRVLGPVAVIDDDGGTVDVGGRKEKCVLAALLLAEGKPVSVDRLCACVWGDELPSKARETLHAYISRLRKHLRAGGL